MSAARKAAFFDALRATGNQTLAAEAAKVSRSWVCLHRAQDPEFRRAFDFYLSFFRDGLAPAFSNSQIANIYQQFAAGDFAMYITGPWNVGEFRRKLPPEVQKAFADSSGEAWLREVGRIWTQSEDVGIAMAVKAGNKHIQLTDAEMAAFRAKLEPVVQRWIDEVKAKGIDGQALVSAAREAIARRSK